MKFNRSLKSILWVVPFLVGIAGALTAEAAGAPSDLRMHLKFSDSRPEVKFTDSDFQDRKVKICPDCRVEVKNDSGKTLYVSLAILDGRAQYVLMTDPVPLDEPRPAYDVPSSVAALSIIDGEGHYFTKDGVTYQDVPVNPVKSMSVSAELDPVRKMNFINQYGGDGANLDYQFGADWIVTKNAIFKVEMEPGDRKSPTAMHSAGYIRFDLDAGPLFQQNSTLKFFEKDKTEGSSLPIHSGVTEVRLEGKAPQHYPAIPFRTKVWQSSDESSRQVFIMPYEGEDRIYHPENHEWLRLIVKRGAAVTSYDLKPKTTIVLSSGPDAKARFTTNGKADSFESFPAEYVTNFSTSGDELKIGIVGESGGPQLAPNSDSPHPTLPGNFTAPPSCTHCKPVIDDFKNPEVAPDGGDGDDSDGNSDSDTPGNDDGAKGGTFGENASAGGCSLGIANSGDLASMLCGLFPMLLILLRQRRS